MYMFEDPKKTTEQIAQDLLGHLLVKQTSEGIVSGWIVETEAYLGVVDQACHSYQGKRTPRMDVMYHSAGLFYVYGMHGHHLLNLVTQPEGTPQAVLIRAIEPEDGGEMMAARRKKTGIERTNGPGKLTKAMGITKEENGSSSVSGSLYIDWQTKKDPIYIEESPRIGIPNKGSWTEAMLRYTVKGNPYLSKKKGDVSIDNGWLDMVR